MTETQTQEQEEEDSQGYRSTLSETETGAETDKRGSQRQWWGGGLVVPLE